MPNRVPPFRTEHYGAPPFDECECFEHRRIRELEADYRHENEGRRAIEALYTEQKARAEKAEKALEIAEAQVYRWSAGQRDTEQRLADSEARVAELELALEAVTVAESEREAD